MTPKTVLPPKTVSLSILILNDLLLSAAIDKDLYDKALQKLTVIDNSSSTEQPLLVTA